MKLHQIEKFNELELKWMNQFIFKTLNELKVKYYKKSTFKST